MQREHRLTGGKRFSIIHREGRVRANRLLVLKILPNDLDRNRFAFLVGKRIGNAVVRNKLRRRLREVVRLTPVSPGWDMVFIARREAAGVDYHSLQLAAQDLFSKTRLFSAGTTHSPCSQDGGARPWPPRGEQAK
jgi:ribonuclease P protein component